MERLENRLRRIADTLAPDRHPTDQIATILYAGWAPLDFLAAFELLLQQRRADRVQPAQIYSRPDRAAA